MVGLEMLIHAENISEVPMGIVSPTIQNDGNYIN